MSLSKQRKTDSVIVIRCSSSDKEKLKEKASNSSLTLSSYMLKCGLNKRMENKSDYKALGHINRVAALQKNLFNEGGRVGDKEYSEVLKELRNAIKLLIDEIKINDTESD